MAVYDGTQLLTSQICKYASQVSYARLGAELCRTVPSLRTACFISYQIQKAPALGAGASYNGGKCCPHHLWDNTTITFRSFKADLRPHRKAPKRDGDHGVPCPVLAISTQPKKGHFHDTRNSCLGPRHWHGTDNGLCIWSSPTGFDVSRWPRVFRT